MNKLLKQLGLSVLLFLLGGCASVVDAQAPTMSEFTIRPVQQPSEHAEVIYKLLAAELAGKRGHLPEALRNYQQVALVSSDPRIAERAATLALMLKDNTTALEMARRWKALDPKNPHMEQTLALALLRTGELKEATQYLDAVLRAASKSDKQQGYATLAALLGQADDKGLALKIMTQFRDRNPRSAFAQYYHALHSAAADNREQALTSLNLALTHDPRFAAAHLLRARLLLDSGDKPAALAALAKSVSALPRERSLRASYAKLLVENEQLDKARQQFAILLKQNAKDNDALYALGLLAAETKQFDLAETYFLDLIKRKTRLADAYFELGRVEEQREAYAKAQQWYERVEDEERYLAAHMRIGVLFIKSGKLTEATQHFQKMREAHPQQNLILYLAEAEALREAKHYQPAFDILGTALVQHPNDKDLRYARALFAEKLNRMDVFEEEIRAILAADPQNAQALNALGYTLADRTDRYQEALGYIEKALAQMPDDAAVLDSMGWVQYRLGNHAQALEYLRRAYKANTDAEIAAHLSEVLWVSGQHTEAHNIWKEALARDPDSEHLRKLRERFGW